jgi:hypothetical protein
MTRNGRIDKLERVLQPEEPTVRFTMCQAPEVLTPEAHAQYHADRGAPMCFTLDLGHCNVRTD